MIVVPYRNEDRGYTKTVVQQSLDMDEEKEKLNHPSCKPRQRLHMLVKLGKGIGWNTLKVKWVLC